ncbi:unnamed protein product [Onchocerca flexuosa]|uniref:WAPL domain-containing protein n=1 Tax=Onchocerca flexuosa TaxID=387005 RepID=A0A183HQQ7_9BILA|nr:unnamed protein product [Onchocerca flexuosa]
MDAQECLASPVVTSLLSENVDNNSTLLPHLIYASFIINYLDMTDEANIGHYTTSLLYAVAISALASINTICNEQFIDAKTNLNNLVNQMILTNEQFKEDLLSECISLIADGNQSLCLLVALRLLADGLCMEKIEAVFKVSGKNLDSFGIILCSAALRYQGKMYEGYCDPPVSMKHWISHFEMASSLKEPGNLLQLLSQFVVEGRSTLEEYIFTYK